MFRQFIAITTDPQWLSEIHFILVSVTNGWRLLAVLKLRMAESYWKTVFSNYVHGDNIKVTQCFGDHQKFKYFKHLSSTRSILIPKSTYFWYFQRYNIPFKIVFYLLRVSCSIFWSYFPLTQHLSHPTLPSLPFYFMFFLSFKTR